jgi:hypothetical protein
MLTLCASDAQNLAVGYLTTLNRLRCCLDSFNSISTTTFMGLSSFGASQQFQWFCYIPKIIGIARQRQMNETP